MDAFWQLYITRPIEKISVKEVCQLAGYNRSTFYAYFKDVYEILEIIEEETITPEDFRTFVLEQLQNHLHDPSQISIKLMLSIFEKNKETLPILLGEHGDPHFRKKVLKKLTPAVLATFRPLSDEEAIEVAYLVEYQSAAVLSTIAQWYNNGKDIPIEKFVPILVAVTTNGIQKELSKFMKPLFPART
jgi:AcrR family transcriptional regulator